MDSQQEGRVGGVGARTPQVQAAMAAARRVMQDQRSQAQVALDTAVERMLAGLADASQDDHARAETDAVREPAPAVHVVRRSAAPAAPGR